MKRKTLLLAIPLLLLSLAGCTSNPSNGGNDGGNQDQQLPDDKPQDDNPPGQDDPSQEENPSEDEETPIVELETEYVNLGSSDSNSFMVEINFGRYLAHDSRYDCGFTVTNLDKTLRIVSSRPESGTIEQSAKNKTKFTVVTHAPGDSIIKIYDVDDVLVYRNVVKVRKGYSAEDIGKAMYDNDIYRSLKAYGSNYRLSINSYSPLQGTLRGHDDVETDLQITFSAQYDSFIENWDMYKFILTTETQNEESTTRVTSLTVSRAADCICIFYATGGEEPLLDQLFVQELADQYNETYENN